MSLEVPIRSLVEVSRHFTGTTSFSFGFIILSLRKVTSCGEKDGVQMKVLTRYPHTERRGGMQNKGREDGKEGAVRGRGMAGVVTLASLHQDRWDKKKKKKNTSASKLISFNLHGYCYFIIPFEEEPRQERVSFSLLSTNYYFGLISKVVSLCTSEIGAFALRRYKRVTAHHPPPRPLYQQNLQTPLIPPNNLYQLNFST